MTVSLIDTSAVLACTVWVYAVSTALACGGADTPTDFDALPHAARTAAKARAAAAVLQVRHRSDPRLAVAMLAPRLERNGDGSPCTEVLPAERRLESIGAH